MRRGLLLMIVLLWLAGTGLAEQHRSSKWPGVREAWIKDHPTCAACGARADLDVHHVKPVHLFPELELAAENLITLCRKDHLKIGHLGNWDRWNPKVVKDAAEKLAEKTKHRK